MFAGQQFIQLQSAQDAGIGFPRIWLSVALVKGMNDSRHLQWRQQDDPEEKMSDVVEVREPC